MSTITVYTFDDGNDGGEDCYQTQNPREAEEYALRYGKRCWANEYEYTDREVAWNYSQEVCDRCGAETDQLFLSADGESMICPDCSEKEDEGQGQDEAQEERADEPSQG